MYCDRKIKSLKVNLVLELGTNNVKLGFAG
mgnify:CR=1 FL=1